MRSKRFFITIGIVAFFAVTGLIYTINYFSSSRVVTVSAKNINNLSLSSAVSGDADDKSYPGTTTRLRVKKDVSYRLIYTGANGYADGDVAVTPETQNITINPDYSAEKLHGMLTGDLPTIQSIIRTEYPSIDQLYVLDTGNLAHYGEWYFTTLTYKGSSDDESSDTLVVGLQKVDNTWKFTLTPNIVFTTHDYPDASRAFVDAANQYRSTHITASSEE